MGLALQEKIFHACFRRKIFHVWDWLEKIRGKNAWTPLNRPAITGITEAHVIVESGFKHCSLLHRASLFAFAYPGTVVVKAVDAVVANGAV